MAKDWNKIDHNPRAWQEGDRWRCESVLDGKKIRVSRSTKASAERAIIEKQKAIREGLIEPKRTTVLTINQWLANDLERITTGSGAVAPSTTDRYRYDTEAILKPCYELTGTWLDRLDAVKIQNFRHKLDTVPTLRTGKPLSAGRQKALEIRLNAALNAAVQLGVIDRNPFPHDLDKNATRRKNEKEREDALERAEKEAIFDRITWYPQRIYRYLKSAFEADPTDWNHTRLTAYLLSFYGLRPSEVRGLTIDKFNPWTKKLVIEQQLYGTKIVDRTKTAAGTREIPVSEPLFSVLKEQAKRQKANPANTKGLLLVGKKNGVFRQQNQNEDWKKLIETEMGTSRNWKFLRLYANRHIAITILEEAKFDRTAIKRFVGWSTNEKNMFDIYSHVKYDPKPLVDAAEIIGNYILREPK